MTEASAHSELRDEIDEVAVELRKRIEDHRGGIVRCEQGIAKMVRLQDEVGELSEDVCRMVIRELSRTTPGLTWPSR